MNVYEVFWSFTPNISVYNVYTPHCSLYISYDANKENLLKNQDFLNVMIISFILVTLILIQGWYSTEKFDACYSNRSKG